MSPRPRLSPRASLLAIATLAALMPGCRCGAERPAPAPAAAEQPAATPDVPSAPSPAVEPAQAATVADAPAPTPAAATLTAAERALRIERPPLPIGSPEALLDLPRDLPRCLDDLAGKVGLLAGPLQIGAGDKAPGVRYVREGDALVERWSGTMATRWRTPAGCAAGDRQAVVGPCALATAPRLGVIDAALRLADPAARPDLRALAVFGLDKTGFHARLRLVDRRITVVLRCDFQGHALSLLHSLGAGDAALVLDDGVWLRVGEQSVQLRPGPAADAPSPLLVREALPAGTGLDPKRIDVARKRLLARLDDNAQRCLGEPGVEVEVDAAGAANAVASWCRVAAAGGPPVRGPVRTLVLGRSELATLPAKLGPGRWLLDAYVLPQQELGFLIAPAP